MPSRAHTITSPPPGDQTLPYLPPYITFRTNFNILPPPLSTPVPPLFLPTRSSRTPMAAIIASYSVYAHYHQRVGMYVCKPARVGACMYAERGFRIFSLFRVAYSGPIDSFLWPHGLRLCCPRWDRMDLMPGNLLRMICHRFDLSLPVFRGSKGRNYRCSSFGGHIAYIHHLFQRMLLSCGVWSAYGSPIASASWIERLYVWEERGFTSTSLLHLHKSLFVPFSAHFLGQVIFP
jgi:hypothetical protein